VKKNRVLILVTVVFFVLTACATETKQQKGTAVGAGVGAIAGAALGQAIGRDRQATLWGAAIGAAVGGLAGNQIGGYMDRQEQELRDALAASAASSAASAAAAEAASVQREADVLTATFKSDVFFRLDSADLLPGAQAEMDRVANVLNRYPQTTIRVEGHTDSIGREDYNQVLSERRAKAVAEALYQRNVSPDRISTVGYGESQPISSDHAMNRRVNIVITPIRQG
jgi:outer membrane protein OmpA-like peptidoglycan-associated protein